MILAFFDLQITSKLPIKFQVNWHFGSGEEAKNQFSRWPQWQPSCFDQKAIFDLPATLMLPSKFQVNWPFGSGEVKNRLQDGSHLGFLIKKRF